MKLGAMPVTNRVAVAVKITRNRKGQEETIVQWTLPQGIILRANELVCVEFLQSRKEGRPV